MEILRIITPWSATSWKYEIINGFVNYTYLQEDELLTPEEALHRFIVTHPKYDRPIRCDIIRRIDLIDGPKQYEWKDVSVFDLKSIYKQMAK
jgi:hypothetical protein